MDANTLNLLAIFKFVYRIFMYDFDSIFMNSDNTQKLYYLMQFFFFGSSFVLTCVLIELLVAFMCDTFDRVLGEDKSAKNYELA